MLRGAAFNRQVLSCYGYNDDKLNSNGGLRDPAEQFGLQGHYQSGEDLGSIPFTMITEAEVIVPSEMMAVGDCFEGNGLLMREPIESFEGYGNIHSWHQGKANVVFCDAHVESPRLEFLFEDASDSPLVRWNRDHRPHREKW